MVTIEELPEEEEVTEREFVPSVTTKTVSLAFSQGQEESTDSNDMRSSSQVEMMTFMGMP